MILFSASQMKEVPLAYLVSQLTHLIRHFESHSHPYFYNYAILGRLGYFPANNPHHMV